MLLPLHIKKGCQDARISFFSPRGSRRKGIAMRYFYHPKSRKKEIQFWSSFQDTPAGTLQRKKSLPDVQCLDVTTKAQGSKAMTREEISVLSSARREAVRKQLEEIERYKSNPFLYILNPRVKVSTVQWCLLGYVVKTNDDLCQTAGMDISSKADAAHFVHQSLLGYYVF